jgi:DNA primase
MANWINFAELRARVSLEDVLVRFYGITNLKRDGDKLIGPCPVHGGDSPRAFHADLSKHVWHCFTGCRGGGNQLDLVAKKENLSIRDAALKLQAFFPTGTAPSHPSEKIAAAPPTIPANVPAPAQLSAPSPAQADSEEEHGNEPITVKLVLAGDHPHLVDDRKFKPETVQTFGVGYCSRGILRGMIAIPIHDEDGDLVAFAGRRLKPSDIRDHGKYKLPKGFKKERVVYRFHAVKDQAAEHGLIVVEGFFAAMKLHEAGLTNVVATMGVETSPYQAALLSKAKDLVVLFDGDEAGTRGANALREQLGGTLPVRVVRLPPRTNPDHLSPKALRWMVNGVRMLDLLELSYTPNVPVASP